MLAVRTGHAELMLEEGEAKSMMKAAQNVARHYSVETTQKTMDIVALFICIGGVYGPRFVAISAKGKKDKPAALGEVVPFPGTDNSEAGFFDGSEHIEP